MVTFPFPGYASVGREMDRQMNKDKSLKLASRQKYHKNKGHCSSKLQVKKTSLFRHAWVLKTLFFFTGFFLSV